MGSTVTGVGCGWASSPSTIGEGLGVGATVTGVGCCWASFLSTAGEGLGVGAEVGATAAGVVCGWGLFSVHYRRGLRSWRRGGLDGDRRRLRMVLFFVSAVPASFKGEGKGKQEKQTQQEL